MKINRGVMLFVTLVLGTGAGYFMSRLLGLFPSMTQIAPAVLLTIVSTPVLYLWQCISKMTELEKLNGISKSEFRRLSPKIKASKLFYWGKIVFIVIGNFTLGFLFFLAPTELQILELPIIKWAVGLLGFMAVFGLVSLLECYSETNTIQQFEAKISRREMEKKLVSETLSKLKT